MKDVRGVAETISDGQKDGMTDGRTDERTHTQTDEGHFYSPPLPVSDDKHRHICHRPGQLIKIDQLFWTPVDNRTLSKLTIHKKCNPFYTVLILFSIAFYQAIIMRTHNIFIFST